MNNRHGHPVVVGNGVVIQTVHLVESRIRRRRRQSGETARKRTQWRERIHAIELRRLMQPVISHVAHGQRGVCSDLLLYFQAPLLVVRERIVIWRVIEGRRGKLRPARLQLRKRDSLRETVHERSVGIRGDREKASWPCGFIWRKKSAIHEVRAYIRSIAGQVIHQLPGEPVVEDAEPSAHHQALSESARLPREAKPRRPFHPRIVFERGRKPRIDDLVVRNIRGVRSSQVRVVYQCRERFHQVREAVALARRI